MAEIGKKCIEIGKRIGNIENQTDLENYIDKVCDVDPSCKYAEEYSFTLKESEYDVYLQIEEISAEGLVGSKKPGRTRDPSCKVAVVTQENLNFAFPKSAKKDKRPKKGTSAVFQTEVKKSTLEPQWNKLDAFISLPVPTTSNTVLLAEIWDNGDNVKSLGRIMVPLKGVSVEGVSEEVCKELPLWKGQPGGKIRLKFRLKVQMRDQSMEKVVVDYEKMLDVFCSRKADSSHSSLPSLKFSSSPTMSHLSGSSSCPSIIDAIYKPVPDIQFCGELDPSAESILALCAEYFGISKLHQAFMKFNVAMRYSCAIGDTIVGHLATIVEHCDQWEDRLQLLNFKDCSALQKWEREQMHELLNNCESFHEKIKISLSTSPSIISQWNAEQVKTFSCELRILELMYKMRVFREILPVDERDMKQVVNTLLQSSFQGWSLELLKTSKDFTIHTWNLVLMTINNILKKVFEKLRASFSEVNIEFFKVVYVTVGEQIDEHIPKDDSQYHKDPKEALNVFMMLKNFRDLPQLFHEYVDPAEQRLVNFHVHFAKIAHKWVSTTADNMCNRIDKASSALKEETVTNDDVFSVNSRDTVDLIVALCQFLDSTLQWPDPDEFHQLLELLLVRLSEAVMLFAVNVQHVLRSSGYCTPVGSEHFTVTKKLCIAMSDIEHVRLSVACEELSGYFQWYEAEGRGLEDEKVKGILSKMDRDVHEIQNKLIEGIVVQMTPHIKECLKLSLKNRDDSYKKRLMDYLNTNMKMCGKGLQESLLLRLLEPLWHSILDVMTTRGQKLAKESVVSDTYHYGMLQMLQSFVWADGSGLRKDQIETEKYWALNNKLHFHTLSNKEVFQVYCMELADKQSDTFAEKDHPSLTVMAEYRESDSTVQVNLIKASDLPPLSHGHKPPRAYFKISTIPEVNFPGATRVKSDVYEPSLNPVLDKEYSFSTSREVLEDDGNIIMVEMYSHSQAKAHKPVGLAVLPCKEIPATGKNCSVLDASKKFFELAILKPPRSPAFEELSKRNSCAEFVKHMKKLMQSHSL